MHGSVKEISNVEKCVQLLKWKIEDYFFFVFNEKCINNTLETLILFRYFLK